MTRMPFLKPNLAAYAQYADDLQRIDDSSLYSNFGPLNTRFEGRVLAECFGGVGASTTVANATLGLMLAIAECKRGQGRYALMPSFTFAATPLAAQWCGLEPYFVDIDADNWCADEGLMVETARRLGDAVAVVVPYATFGTALDLAAYRSLHESGVPVVVDAAASFGTTCVDGQYGTGFPGSVVFSFHATKAFGIGEGGLVYSGDAQRIEGIRRSSNFGFSAARESASQGLNAKLSEYAAAIALATLDAYAEKVARRQEIYRIYTELLDAGGLFERGWSLQQLSGQVPHQFMPALCPDGQSNAAIVERLASDGIESRTYFSPACHQQRQFASSERTSLDVTERIAGRAVSLPLWEAMQQSDVERVVAGLARA